MPKQFIFSSFIAFFIESNLYKLQGISNMYSGVKLIPFWNLINRFHATFRLYHTLSWLKSSKHMCLILPLFEKVSFADPMTKSVIPKIVSKKLRMIFSFVQVLTKLFQIKFKLYTKTYYVQFT